MAELEDDIRNKQARLNKAKQELDDKSAVIQTHLNTITVLIYLNSGSRSNYKSP